LSFERRTGEPATRQLWRLAKQLPDWKNQMRAMFACLLAASAYVAFIMNKQAYTGTQDKLLTAMTILNVTSNS